MTIRSILTRPSNRQRHTILINTRITARVTSILTTTTGPPNTVTREGPLLTTRTFRCPNSTNLNITKSSDLRITRTNLRPQLPMIKQRRMNPNRNITTRAHTIMANSYSIRILNINRKVKHQPTLSPRNKYRRQITRVRNSNMPQTNSHIPQDRNIAILSTTNRAHKPIPRRLTHTGVRTRVKRINSRTINASHHHLSMNIATTTRNPRIRPRINHIHLLSR